MKKFLITIMFILSGFSISNATNPVSKEITTEEVVLNNKDNGEPILHLNICIDGEQVSFNATKKIIKDNIIYVFGTGTQVKALAFKDKELKIYLLNNQTLVIKCAKIDHSLMRDIEDLPTLD